MNRVWALLLATVREGVRSQVFFNLALFAFFAVGGALVLEQLSLGEPSRALWDAGLALLSFVNTLLCVMMTVRTLGADEDRQALLTVMVRPIRRSEVLLGKYLGLCTLAALNTAGAGALIYLAALATSGATRPLFLPLLGLVVEASLVTVVTLFFATLAGSTVAALMGLCTWLVGLGAAELRDFAGQEHLGTLQPFMKVVYLLVPNLQRLDFNAHPVPVEEALLTIVYAVAYAAMVGAAAALVFERRDLR
jgi:ABC-type transport system involved in multi-copper enzyme maturation permease subunit